jgi:hypothetical protein
MIQVEVRATLTEGDCVVWCSPADAQCFSVYHGEPGGFKWLADFNEASEALWYAQFIAARDGSKFVNRIGEF